MLDRPSPSPRYAFGAPVIDRTRGIAIEERQDLSLATVMLRRTVDPERLTAALGITPPTDAGWSGNGPLTLAATGPGVWLAIMEAAPLGWTKTLASHLAGIASIADQSGAYTILHISGLGARKFLARGAYIDFDPAAFTARSAAATMISHMGVTLWQHDDAPTFGLALARSFTGSFRHWAEETVATLPVLSPT